MSTLQFKDWVRRESAKVMAKRRKERNVKKFRTTSKKIDKAHKEDKFFDEDTALIVEDAYVSQPSYNEVREVVADMDGFRDWQRESRGNGLTFGGY